MDGCTVGKTGVSDGHRPNHGNPGTGMLSTISTSGHSSICCLTFSDSGRMICCVRLLSSRHTVSHERCCNHNHLANEKSTADAAPAKCLTEKGLGKKKEV